MNKSTKGRKPQYTGKLDEILDLLARNLSVREVALRTGISKSTIGRIRKGAFSHGFGAETENAGTAIQG